jgi:hypothetical protein
MTKVFNEKVQNSIRRELAALWAGHHAVGLKGQMCLYTLKVQEPWRSKEAGLAYWFGPDDTEKLLPEIEKHYNEGALPNSPLLLNPIVHDENHKPLGSGIVWATGFALGIETMQQHQRDRINSLGVFTGMVERSQVKNAGLKMVGFSTRALPPLEDGITVEGCRELFEIANFANDEYYRFYLLSGLTYLGKHGGFEHPDFKDILPEDVDIQKIIQSQRVDVQLLKDALFCWESYDRHDSLYRKFGVAPDKVENNLKFYNLCARDVVLFDATGAKHVDAATAVTFDFIVDGWIPRGAVTVIGASGGTGKSSLAHNLAVKASIDYREDEPKPTWLGSKINLEYCKGLCVYFSGEDGPAIVHARAKVFDPEGRAHRLMFQRTDFGEGGTLSTFLKRLMKLPEVPLVVIDPARKYLTGDENDAGAVSEFFEAIEEFAIRKNSAMVVVHHLVKGAKPRHVLDIYDLLRGSQVFIDRARVVIGIYREGQMTVAGLSKNNIPPQLGMVMGERLYARDGKHLELVLVPGPEGIRGDSFSDEQIEAIKSHG